MKVIATVCILFVIAVTSQAQFAVRTNELPKDTLAAIGTQIITAKDYLERFELMPWPHKDKKQRIEFTKREFLYSMVAEKLLAMEASAKNIGVDSVTLKTQQNLERIFVRDELYKREVLPNLSIAANETKLGLSRFPYEIEAEVLGILSKQEGDILYKKITQSKNKTDALKFFFDSLYIPIDTIIVSFGFPDKVIEDAVFSIGKDTLSKPIETQSHGWVMFRLLKKYSHLQNSRLSHPDRVAKVNNIIKQRKEDSLATKAFAAITAPQRAEAKPDLFFSLADSIMAILKSDSVNYFAKNIYQFPASALNILQVKFADRLTEDFIIIESGNMTLGDVLTGLSNNNVVFPSPLNIDHLRIVLNNNIKTVIQNELLSREGMKKNLQQSENVRHDVSTWMDNRKSWLLTRAILDTIRVSEAEIEGEYQKNPRSYGATVMVRIKEILVDSIPLAKNLRERINNGEEFSELAKKYSKRKDWNTNGGESPWIDVGMWGELGLFAASANIGDINGPWKIKEGLTIFKVIERKIIDDSLRANFTESRRIIEQKVLNEKSQQTLDKFIGTLAKKYNVTINEASLRNVNTTSTNMFTWRHIGFGGRIVAVPQMMRQTEWVYEWLKQEQLNQ